MKRPPRNSLGRVRRQEGDPEPRAGTERGCSAPANIEFVKPGLTRFTRGATERFAVTAQPSFFPGPICCCACGRHTAAGNHEGAH